MIDADIPVSTPSAIFTAKSVQDTVNELNSNLTHGLSSNDVDFRRRKFGRNELEVNDTEPLYLKFLDQLKQPLILLLLGSALVSVCLGQMDDAISIFLAVIIVITVAFVQEYRSEKSLEALNKLVPHYCHVIRNGHVSTLLALELVPGDLVTFSMGDRIPADIRLCQAVDLEIDESNLSGETKPSRKVVHMMPSGAIPVVDRKNIAFMGTLVRCGHGRGVVIGTAKDTEFGSIWSMMQEVENKKTPLQNRMELLGKQLSILSFGIIGFISVIGLIQGREWLDTFTIAVSLAVAAIPEGLPIVVTVTLALGVLRMANKHAIVKRLPSVEALGSVNIICADKTGTLTMNKMAVTQIYTVMDGIVSLEESVNLNTLSIRTTIRRLVQSATLCNNAHWRENSFIGQPTETAILELVQRLDFPDDRSTIRRHSEVPFDSMQKWMSVQCEIGQTLIHFAKGAPEVILDKCRRYFVDTMDVTDTLHCGKLITPDHRRSLFETNNQLSHRGLRVIAVAFGSDLNDLIFLGYLAMSDPPREGCAAIIRELHQSGVKVVMISGDSKGTSMSIASKVGILPSLAPHEQETMGHLLMSGAELDQMASSGRNLQSVVGSVSVFYRTTPKHKLLIVKALQARGDVVAMTGDGVNDAPALKTADIGIAMGKTGTDVSKEAADMILVNGTFLLSSFVTNFSLCVDNIATVLAAIEEGKGIYYNIRNFLRFQLSTSVAALTLVASSTVFHLPTPLNAMQILWINIIMDGPPAQSLGVEPVDKDVMAQPPRRRDMNMIDPSLIKRVLFAALMIVVGTLLVFRSELQDGVVTARDTTMTFTTFVFFDMFNALSCRSEKKSVFRLGLFSNHPFLYAVGLSVLGQLLVIYMPFFQAIFQTESLPLNDLLRITAWTSSVFWVDEAYKLWMWIREDRRYGRWLGWFYRRHDKEYEAV